MKNERRDILKAFAMISQLGLTFVTPIGICIIAGHYLDKAFGTSCWFIILFILGVLAAFRNAYQITKTFYHKDLLKEKKELEYWDNLKKNYSSTKQVDSDQKGNYKK